MLTEKAEYYKIRKTEHIHFTEPMEREANYMCNLSEGVYERGYAAGILLGEQRGIQQGMQQGMQKGMQQGMQKGMQQGRTALLYELVQSGILNVRQASEKAEMPVEEFLRRMKEYR